MDEVSKEIRFAQLASRVNIGTGNLAQLMNDLGHMSFIDHESVVKNVPLNEDIVETYLSQKNLKNSKIFYRNFVSSILKITITTPEYFSIDEIKQKIKEQNAVYPDNKVVFSIPVNEFAHVLRIDKNILSLSLLSMFPQLPTEIHIKASTKIPENLVKEICDKEGIDPNDIWNPDDKNLVAAKHIKLEGPKVVGTIDLTKPLGKVLRLAKAAGVYSVSEEQIMETLKQAKFVLTGNPNEKLSPEMIAILDKQFSTEKAVETVITLEPNFKPSEQFHPININNNPITMKSPIQKILFGSPGTGKSWSIENNYLKSLNISAGSDNCIKTVFHPEYTYGDFMGKLMPYTNDEGSVEYRFYSGHFLKALAKAFKNIILSYIQYKKAKEDLEKAYKKEVDKSNKKDFTDEEKEALQRRLDNVQKPVPENVALVIDEINRGNSAAIFGVGFQLLDRDENGWSSYPVRITELEYRELLKEITLEHNTYKRQGVVHKQEFLFDASTCSETEYTEFRDIIYADLADDRKITFLDRNIKLPPNLSIISSMNTSDNSIYFMDSAFKRRWDWEFIDITSEGQKKKQIGRKLADGSSWQEFVDNLNTFIKDNGSTIRKIEDKQIGYFFIKGAEISIESIRNKLQFFLWDSIFSNDKKPLERLLGNKVKLITFGDFVKESQAFIAAIQAYKPNTD